MSNARDGAVRLLAIAASSGGTLQEIADAIGESPPAVLLARRVLTQSIQGANWRATRAEAEARLRCAR